MKTGKLLVGLVGLGIFAIAGSANAGTVRATGKVVYYQNGANGGSQLPMAGVRVSVIDDDGVGDDLIRSGYADANGNFDLSGTQDDCWGCGKLDPYLVIELESSGGKVIVESEVLKINVTCATGVKDNTEGTISYGNIACGGEAKDASALFGYMSKSYANFTAQTSQTAIPRHNGKSAALFPAVLAAGVPWTTEESIHWPGGYRTFGSVYHEFGHRIRHGQDGDFSHFLSDAATYSYPQQHTMTKVTNAGFAFNEGWAEYYASLLDANEASKLANWNINGTSNGSNSVEGNVAARLAKLSKDCGGFKRMWSTLQMNGIHSYSDFANKMKSVFSANSTLKTQFPSCMPDLVASIDADELRGGHDHDMDFTRELLAQNDPGVMGVIGAFAPTGINAEEGKAPLADQTNTLSRMGDQVKDRAAKKKARNPLEGIAKLRGVGAKIASDRDAFEVRSAAKLDKHLKSSKPIDGTKDSLEKRKNENAAFVKDVLSDRLAMLQASLAQVKAEQAKNPSGDEAKALGQLRTKLEKTINDLGEAIRTGNIQPKHLPASFHMPAGAA